MKMRLMLMSSRNLFYFSFEITQSVILNMGGKIILIASYCLSLPGLVFLFHKLEHVLFFL